jgi:hypothetical protein
MMLPFHAMRPLNIHKEKLLIDNILTKTLSNELEISFDQFNSHDHAFVIITMSGWLLRKACFTQMELNLMRSYIWAVLKCIENEPDLKPLFIKSIFGIDAIEREELILPLDAITKNIPFSTETRIRENLLFVPPHVYREIIPDKISSSFTKMLESFDHNIEKSIKKDIECIFDPTLINLRKKGMDEGPWLLYETQVPPLMKFAVDILLKPVKENTLSLVDIRDAISDHVPSHQWDNSFKKHLLQLNDNDLIGLYKKIEQTKKIPELREVNNYSITLQQNDKVSLSSLADIEKLKEFPCIKKIMELQYIPHNILTALFSILLWFYSTEECHTILKEKMRFERYDRQRTERQIYSLLDHEGYPKYFYGTRGFEDHCIGYNKCRKCWVNLINFPEEYYVKKRLLRKNYSRTEEAPDKCILKPMTLTI